MSEFTVDPQKVLERLVSEPIGAALWKAAVAEEKAEMLSARVAELERQNNAAISTPRHTQDRTPDVRPTARADRDPDDPPPTGGPAMAR